MNMMKKKGYIYTVIFVFFISAFIVSLSSSIHKLNNNNNVNHAIIYISKIRMLDSDINKIISNLFYEESGINIDISSNNITITEYIPNLKFNELNSQYDNLKDYIKDEFSVTLKGDIKINDSIILFNDNYYDLTSARVREIEINKTGKTQIILYSDFDPFSTINTTIINGDYNLILSFININETLYTYSLYINPSEKSTIAISDNNTSFKISVDDYIIRIENIVGEMNITTTVYIENPAVYLDIGKYYDNTYFGFKLNSTTPLINY